MTAALAASVEVATSASEGAAASEVSGAAAAGAHTASSTEAEEAAAIPQGVVIIAVPGGPLVIGLPEASQAACDEPEPETEEAAAAEPRPAPQTSASRPHPPTAARNRVRLERLERAFEAGRNALPKLRGLTGRVPATPTEGFEDASAKRFFVLLKGKRGIIAEGFYPGRWAGFAWYVETCSGQLDGSSVYHGWASQTEAEEYWRAAGRQQPWMVLPPRWHQ